MSRCSRARSLASERAPSMDARRVGKNPSYGWDPVPGIAVLTLTATRELHLEPLEVRGNLEGVRTLLSLPFSHVVERCYALGARRDTCAVSTLLLGFRDGNSFSRLAFDDLANLPYETCLITFIHPTKWEQSVHLTTKLISNKTRIDPVARDGLLFLESSRLVCLRRRGGTKTARRFSLLDASSALLPRLSRSPRRYTSFMTPPPRDRPVPRAA